DVTWVRLFWSDRPGGWHKSRRRAVPRHAAGPAGPTDPAGPASPAAATASSDINVTPMSSWRHGCGIHVVPEPPARPRPGSRQDPSPGTTRSMGTAWIQATRRESELAYACCESTVSTPVWCRGAGRDNSIGGDRFRLWWLNQGKRAEGCGCDLVNPVAANQ